MTLKDMTLKDAFVGFITIAFTIIFMVIILLFSFYFEGYVVMKLWDWFVIPTFGLPKLSIYTAIGIMLLMGLLTHQSDIKKMLEERTTKEKWLAFALLFLRPAMFLFIGYVVKILMVP
jgi:hypothetical protein